MKSRFFSYDVRTVYLLALAVTIIIVLLISSREKDDAIQELKNNPRIMVVERPVYLPKLSAQQILPIILARQPRLDSNVAAIIADAIVDSAEKRKISPVILMAVIEVESGYDQMAMSKKFAKGLMQIQDIWLKDSLSREAEVTEPKHLFQIRPNIQLGSSILRKLFKDYLTTREAFASYYGSKDVDHYLDKVMKAMGEITLAMSFEK